MISRSSDPPTEPPAAEPTATNFWMAIATPLRMHYYHRVRGALLTALRHRPLVVTHVAEFQDWRRTEYHPVDLPDWMSTDGYQVQGRTHWRPVVTSIRGLEWFINTGAVEFYTTQWTAPPRTTRPGVSRATRPPLPDHMVFNLDPGTDTNLHACAEVARTIIDIAGADLATAVPVSTGHRGLHLYLPVSGLTCDEILDRARRIAKNVAAVVPTLATATTSRHDRHDRVFIDTAVNRVTATTIAPYSLRASHPFNVAAPRTWQDLNHPDVTQLTLRKVLAQLPPPLTRTSPHTRFY